MSSDALLMFGISNDVYVYGLSSTPTSKDVSILINNSVSSSFERGWVQVGGQTMSLFRTRTRTVAILGDFNALMDSIYTRGKEVFVLSVGAYVDCGLLIVPKEDFNYILDCHARNLFVTEHGFSNYDPSILDVDLRQGVFGSRWVEHGNLVLSNLLNHYIWLGFDESGSQVIGDLVYARR